MFKVTIYFISGKTVSFDTDKYKNNSLECTQDIMKSDIHMLTGIKHKAVSIVTKNIEIIEIEKLGV